MYRNNARSYGYGRPRKRRDNLEYYVRGVRVRKEDLGVYLGNLYGMPPKTALECKLKEAKRVLNMPGCDTYYSASEGIMIKR